MGDEAMTSMFYVDGDRLLMTHFCPSNKPAQDEGNDLTGRQDGIV